jgi:DNA-binding LacI/PurR family transcriptional regulator
MLSRKSIREFLKNYPGAVSRIAKRLGVTRGHVSRWLNGERQSERVEAACREEVERLMDGEGRSR